MTEKTRREFLASTSALAATALLMPGQSLADILVDKTRGDNTARTIIGYCWPQTVRSGQSLDVMVSTHTKDPYQASLVRLICADNLSSATMFKEDMLNAPFTGSYPGRYQPTHIGSYVEISEDKANQALSRVKRFTVQTSLFPTWLPGVENQKKSTADASEKPSAHEQFLISRWDNQEKQGWGLLIDQQGRLAFILGDGEQIHTTTLDKPLIQKQWYSVVASVDTVMNRVHITAEVVTGIPADKVAWPKQHIDDQSPKNLPLIQSGPLRFGACTDGPGNQQRLKPGGCFNGKLDGVRLSADVLTQQQAVAINATRLPKNLKNKVLGFWDFGKGINTINVTDLSRHQLHGIAVNLPMRAVTGIHWDGTEDDWQQAPDHYSAIYFHDDDLYDAEWKVDFNYSIPNDLSSGIYAVRLRQGESEDYIPFFVVPPKGKATTPLALLLPTANYLAYANKLPMRIPIWLHRAEDAAYEKRHLPELGKGTYHRHTDGTQYAYSSQKHPNIAIKPKSTNKTFVADTYITDWLEHIGIDYDIITDDLLHQEGIELLKNYQVVMTGSHPEYYSTNMLNAVANYQDIGGRLMYLGGNGFFWVTSYHSQLPGVIEVRKNGIAGMEDYEWDYYEMKHAADGVVGGLWKDNARPANHVVGVHYNATNIVASDPYQRQSDSYHPRAVFIFEGVNNEVFGDYGIIGNGASGYEYDHISYEQGTPAHALHLARASLNNFPESSIMRSKVLGRPMHGADMVYFEVPKGGAVFSVGSIAWVGALSHNNYTNDVARITENVLRRFLDKTPLPLP